MSRVRLFAVVLLVLAALPAMTGTAAAAMVEGEREWRSLSETKNISYAEAAAVCPLDGVQPCSGTAGGRDLTGWVWANGAQMIDLLDNYWPGLSANPPQYPNASEGFSAAMGFIDDLGYTGYQSVSYTSYAEWGYGISSSLDSAGAPFGGGAEYSHSGTGTTASGSIGSGSGFVGGLFLWRVAGSDGTPPVVAPVIEGTIGSNGWYVSDVGVSWSVSDPESPITSTSGCDPTVLKTDSTGTTYTCTATSGGVGGPATASVLITRDVAPPALACAATPTFTAYQANATVRARVTDATSGPVADSVALVVSPTAPGTFSATVTALDRAGNAASASCAYNVTAAKCQGRAVTVLGTNGNDVLQGTAGSDVIDGFGGTDRIDGVGGNDVICGGAGADLIRGGYGADLVDGGAGNDEIFGGEGADTLDGGTDRDSIRGDGGYDRCRSGELRMSSCATTTY